MAMRSSRSLSSQATWRAMCWPYIWISTSRWSGLGMTPLIERLPVLL
jgi:hypothetical protein